ncbi:hypothetical protein N7G274_005707 [Stereocaulon virgatum]|uniref:glucan endo-1,3-beta-D-glucosidase n=1 Tax=Stereocaulon virgatum TaxID=373712 RepID=A0ABR4A899_9LECA
MHYHSVAGTAVVVAFYLRLRIVNAQACAAGPAQEINGNWYCSEVDAISYANFPGTGYYNKVTDMDESTGECTTERYNYSGSLSPLDEELSLHIRGPTWLKQVAVYTLDTSSSNKRNRRRSAHGHRHGGGHQDLHKHRDELEEVQEHSHKHKKAKRSVGQMVSATIDGQVVSWTNVYAGPGVSTGLSAPVAAQEYDVNDSTPDATTYESYEEVVTISTTVTLSGAMGPTRAISDMRIATEVALSVEPSSAVPSSVVTSSLEAPTVVVSSSTTSAPAVSASWTRQAYYNAADGTSQGITFLNHFGGENGVPGTSAGGPAFGISLSYASSDGQSGAASSQVLSDSMIEDDVEVIVLSDKSCDDGGCGYTRPGGVAYHGFPGSYKLFLIEFSMPSTNRTGFNADMPAIWLMNAQIPLTSQYGENPDCSCWTSGCGEFDIFEILDSGNFRCKSTLHMAPAGGSSDWFLRPMENSVTAAVVFHGSSEVVSIRVLEQGQAFEESLEGSVVDRWVEERSSVFDMAS